MKVKAFSICLIYPSTKVISHFLKILVFPNAKNIALLKANGFFLLAIGIFLCITIVNLNSKEKEGIKWSTYQGAMSWENARARCEEIGMRVPTKLELETAFKTKLTKSWTKDAAVFWTEEEFSVVNAFDQFVSYNPIYWTSEEISPYDAYGFHSILGIFSKNNKLAITSLRCVKDRGRKKVKGFF